MRRLFLSLLLLLVLFSTSSAQAPPAAKVRTAPIVQEEVAPSKGFLGLLYYDRKSEVASEVAGQVERVEVRSGDLVKEGQPLVQLNTELLDIEIALATTRVEQAALQVKLAQKNFQRQQSLLENRGASQRKYDDAQYAFNNAAMEQQAARQTLASLVLKKKKSLITAPFDGVILDKGVDSGDWVKQGGEVVAIGASQALYIKVPVGETLLRYLEAGSEVEVVINAFETAMGGIIDTIEPRADAKTKNVFVKIRIPPLSRGAENMSATVYLPIGARQRLSIIPRDALITFQGKDFIYTIKEGKAAILPVHIVTFLGERVAADNPYLVPGMPVVVEGNERLRPDQAVMVTGE
ncbi:efflux RND transporter periplasmic adaptor subunit [Desulfogranum mediterraneum]|uniref:efflux RND transporter periplasmic adaptor subunit n=1 Tax=Desulfogranum mediterraneum TaxID=160661 RepID=UPI000427534C|nr:efflux RND transporter periplasmic adaptor subunit [Desulfogranum mediterraneum]